MKHKSIGSSPAFPHKTHLYYLLCLLECIDVTQIIDNTVEGCLLYHLLEYENEAPASRELFKTYFITIRYLEKKQPMERNIPGKKNLSFSKII